MDSIEIEGNRIKKTLPVVLIYMLGFKLPGIETVAVKIDRRYIDIISGGVISSKSPFIESLSHDAYFIQIPRITSETFQDWGAPAVNWNKC